MKHLDARPLAEFPEPGTVFIERASGFRWYVGERLPDLGRLWLSPVVPPWTDGRRPPKANLGARRLKLDDLRAGFTPTDERVEPPVPSSVPPASSTTPAVPGAPAVATLSEAQRVLYRQMQRGCRVMFGVVEQRFSGAETTTRYQHMLCRQGADHGRPVSDRTLAALERKGLIQRCTRNLPKTESLGHFMRVMAEPYESYVLAGTPVASTPNPPR